MKKGQATIVIVIILVVIAIGAFFIFSGSSSDNNSPQVNTQNNPEIPNENSQRNAPEEIMDENIVEMTDSGYKPNTLRIKQGETVIFSNVGTRANWPASNIHPTHSVYPRSGISKCDTSEATEIFDACSTVAPGSSYEFTFNEKGSWKYHDHTRTGTGGTIIVE